jgi:predicted dienelactone hydrolase
VGVIGHSLGGITAAEACRVTFQIRSCVNLDGLQQGGPFSADAHPIPPGQPFMMITKEKTLAPAIIALFAAAQSGSYRVVLPEAQHDNFTDGPLLLPSLLPIPNQADQLLSFIRAYTLAFFEQTLNQRPSPLLSKPLHSQSVWLEVYPPQ